ncbi:MAG: hypothetical protein AAGA83_11025 [Cyanobacteria bacterium P01_F01_bin.116]
MEEPNEQHDINLAGGKLVLQDISSVADELILDQASPLSRGEITPKSGSYTIELFSDEALVTGTELLYGDAIYPLGDIDSIQILKLHRKRSIIQKKFSNFLMGVLTTIALAVCLSPLIWLGKLFSVLLAFGSIVYTIYFNWWVEQRGRGEFGLLVTTKMDAKIVITSHSLKAIQALYQIIFGRLDGGNLAGEPLVVNMYTGEMINRC